MPRGKRGGRGGGRGRRGSLGCEGSFGRGKNRGFGCVSDLRSNGNDGPGTNGAGPSRISALDDLEQNGGGSGQGIQNLQQDLQKVRENRSLDKKRINSLSKKDKERLEAMKRKKQVDFFLMPDAPEPKKKSKKISSPVSWAECILVPGTLPEPPPREREFLPKSRGNTAKDIKELHEIETTQIEIDYINMSPSWAAENTDEVLICDDPIIDKDEAALHAVYCEALQATINDSQTEPAVDNDEPILIVVQDEAPQAFMDDGEVKDDAGRESVVNKDEHEQIVQQVNTPQSVTGDTEVKNNSHLDLVIDKDEAAIQGWIQNMDNDHNTLSDLDIDPDDENDITLAATNLSQTFREDIPFELDSKLERQIHSLDLANDSVVQRLLLQDTLNFDWTNNRDSFTGVREQFSGQQGPTFSVSEPMTPLDIFDKIWDSDIILKIVEETNRYAQTITSTKPHIAKIWRPVTANDIWNFLAIIILQGNDPRPVEREYWYSNCIFTQMPYFKLLMPYKRFLLIKRFLHFNDNVKITSNATAEETKLFKIKPIIDHLNDKFQSLFYPGPEVSLDESLLLRKGRLSFSQKILTKAAGVGIKSYELCDSKTGYLWKFVIYTGKSHDHTYQKPHDENQPDGATAGIVFDLARPLFHKGHVLVMDNFYNSPLLTRCLKQHGTDTIGTLRISREFVPETLKQLTKTNMRVGQVGFSMTYDMTIVVWRDANIVSMISSYHKAEVGGKEKHGMYKYRPKVVLDYNLAMGGVDRKDQLLAAFPMERCKNLIWYKKLFRRLFNTSILNANIIYNCGPTKLTPRDFRQTLFELMVKRSKPNIAQSITIRSAELPAATVEGQGHYPERGQSKQARCKWCARSKILTRTTWQCDVCKVSLCIESCFKKYHTPRS